MADVDAATAPIEHTYKFNVSMSCGGCSGAVDRVLKKLDGAFLVFYTQQCQEHRSRAK